MRITRPIRMRVVDAVRHDPIDRAAFKRERAADRQKVFNQLWRLITTMSQQSVKANSNPSTSCYPPEQDRYQHRPPIEHEESGDRTNMKQRKEHGAVPVNTFNSILKRYVVHTPPNTLCWWTGAARDLLSVTFMPHGWKISSTNLILQATTLAVSATTHICFDRQSLTEDYMRPNAQTAQLRLNGAG